VKIQGGGKNKRLKLVLALALLAGLAYIAGSRNLIDVLYSVEPLFFIPLIGISFVLIWLSSVKWQLFIRAGGHDAGVIHLMKIYTISYFYNLFAPSSVMGDIARSLHVGAHVESHRDAFVATFLERLTGLLAMVLLGTTFIALGSQVTAGVELAVESVAFVTVIGAIICFSERAYNLFQRIAVGILRGLKVSNPADRLEKLLVKISSAMQAARNDSPLFFKAMFWSVLFHLGTVVNVYIAARAIGWNSPDFFQLCTVVPLVLLVSIAPVTPSGLGIQEGAFMFFLQRIGASHAESLAIGLLLRAKQLLTALVGWILWINYNSNRKRPSV
jgi:uncharacterized protein (TIRG00374 family)